MLVTATSSATSRRKKQIIRRHGTAFGLIHWRIGMGLMISRIILIHSPSARRATRQLVTNNDKMGFCSPNNLSMHILIPRDSPRIEGRLPPALSDSPFSRAHPGRLCGQHMTSPKRASRVVEIANAHTILCSTLPNGGSTGRHYGQLMWRTSKPMQCRFTSKSELRTPIIRVGNHTGPMPSL